MSVLSVDNGTFTATIGSDNALSQQTGVGVYVLKVDLSNMAASDIVEIRIETRCKPGEDRKVSYRYTFNDAQDSALWHSPPVPIALGDEIACTLLQSAGIGRDFVWNLMTV